MTITNDIIEAKEETRIQVVLTKPTPEEIIKTYIDINDRMHNETEWKYFEADTKMTITKPWQDITNQNSKYLSVMDHEDYDKKAFNMLIASIQLNGKKHFNMTTFIGLLEDKDYETFDDSYRGWGSENDVYGISSDYIYRLKGDDPSPFFKATKTFNCNTVGCIAGFAVATALNWQEDLINKTSNYVYNQIDLFEHLACNFLNIPIRHGKKLFYAERNSFWGMLKHYATDYNDIRISELKIFNDLYISDEEDDYPDYPTIDLSSISPEMAVKALELLRDGHLEVDMYDMPHFSKDYLQALREGK